MSIGLISTNRAQIKAVSGWALRDATYIYAGTAPNAILFKVQKSNSAKTKIYTFGTGGSI
jgi:hypothetical protein